MELSQRFIYGPLLVLLYISLGLSACVKQVHQESALPAALPLDPPTGSYMLTANTYAGDALAAALLRRMDSGSGILASSFVDMSDVEQTSAFGQIIMQQVGSRLGQQGFAVLEARLGATLRVDSRGELFLTRDAASLMAEEHDAHAALVGMYSVAGAKVFISARVVRLADNAIIAAYEYFLPVNDEVAVALGQSGGRLSVGDGSPSGAALLMYAGRGQAYFESPRVNKVMSKPGQARPAAKAQKRQQTTSTAPVVLTLPQGGRVYVGEEFVDKGGGRFIPPPAPPVR